MPRNYVDNAMNRSLGRVGMPLGSAVHSRSSGSSGSYGSSSSFGSYGPSSSFGSYGSSSSYESYASPSRTYVDNSMNRSLGRVGLPLGSAVHSKSSSSSPAHYQSSSGSSSSSRTYVDNPLNQSLGRVGLPIGSAVQSKKASVSETSRPSSSGSSSSSRTYVDNPLNQSLGRVGLPMGTAVHSKKASASGTSLPSASGKVCVDNRLNRKLNGVGQVHKKGDPTIETERPQDRKVYKDNPFNRKHNRVGCPLGSRPIKKGDIVYQDNAVNRYLNRVGLPMGSCKQTRGKLSQIRNFLLANERASVDKEPYDHSYDSGIGEASVISPFGNAEPESDDIDHVLEALARFRQVDEWFEEEDGKSIRDTNEVDPLLKVQGSAICFDELELKDKIGHGGFGEVYFALFKNQVVAVKLLTQANLSKRRLQMFEKEILTHSKLDHPNIVRFYGPCLDRPNLAIVMEYMDSSLWESIHINEVDFLPDHKLKIIQDMTSGLAYLHSVPLAHGDLKTQNVLLINVPGTQQYASDQPVIAKLSDFGLSLLKSDTETSQSSTHTKKHVLGATLRFSAPEVIRGELLSATDMLMADIYSMGLLMLELATEVIPFESFTLPQLMKQVGEKGVKPAPPSGLTLDAPLEAMLDQCWSFSPSQRPSAGKLKKMAAKINAVLIEEE